MPGPPAQAKKRRGATTETNRLRPKSSFIFYLQSVCAGVKAELRQVGHARRTPQPSVKTKRAHAPPLVVLMYYTARSVKKVLTLPLAGGASRGHQIADRPGYEGVP